MSAHDLVSTCYDGRVIRTPWPRERRYYPYVQHAQAQEHREAVRWHLEERGLLRLERVEQRSAA